MDVFISYSSRDLEWKNRVTRHLAQLRMAGVLTYAAWDDSNIEPGDRYDTVIRAAMQEARVALFLVSSDFLSSRYIIDVEVAHFLTRAETGAATIVPLMIRPAAWTHFPWLAELEHFPKGKVLSGLSAHDQEDALTELVDVLARRVEDSRVPDDSASEEAETPVNDEKPTKGRSAMTGEASARTGEAFTFLTEDEVREVIRIRVGGPVLDMERVFRSKTQRTWFAAVEGKIVCLLDDRRTRASNRLIQWKETVGPLTRVGASRKSDSDWLGHASVGRRRGWLVNLRDFGGDPAQVVAALARLKDAAKG